LQRKDALRVELTSKEHELARKEVPVAPPQSPYLKKTRWRAHRTPAPLLSKKVFEIIDIY
jgi:hypothetical protein